MFPGRELTLKLRDGFTLQLQRLSEWARYMTCSLTSCCCKNCHYCILLTTRWGYYIHTVIDCSIVPDPNKLHHLSRCCGAAGRSAPTVSVCEGQRRMTDLCVSCRRNFCAGGLVTGWYDFIGISELCLALAECHGVSAGFLHDCDIMISTLNWN